VRRRDLIRSTFLCALPTALSTAMAQTAFPSRPLRLVVPFPAGGPTDAFARLYAQRLAQVLGRAVVVDNKGGAGGAIGAVEVKNAQADGHVLLFGTASTHCIYNLLAKQPLYDAMRDFTHIAVLGGSPAVFAVGQGMPPTLKGVVDMARASPGKLQYGTPGEATFLHLAGERMKFEAGRIDIQAIPYRGSAQGLQALMGGQVGMTVDTLGSLLQYHKSGKIGIVAIATAKRSPLAPDVPTVDEAIGTRGFEAELWNVVSVPVKVPAAAVAILSAATTKVMSDMSLHKELANLSFTPNTGSNPTAATAYIRAEIEKWRPAVEATGIKV
jgi:tripartite-type tricarboxylate transporter receptor subunit TctC